VKKLFIFFVVVSLASVNPLSAQKRKDKVPVTYEELYDEPYAINKLFVQFQPVYGELFVSNVNAGFGLEATYFWKDKMDFRAHARKTYTQSFDLSRDQADQASDVDNIPNIFNYYEFGATYHIKDFEESSKTKMFLYKKSYKGDRWAARVPLNAEIPCKVRKVYGARLGGLFFDTAVDINRALDAQDQNTSILTDPLGPIPMRQNDSGELEDLRIYSNMNVAGVYVGGSISWIKNIAVDFDNRYTEGVDDLIFTAFLDILVAPSVTVDDIVYTETDPVTGAQVTRTFSSDAIDTTPIGFRAGLDGKFNRTLSWAYGGEIGYRPGLQGRGFYAMVKISFPVFSTNLDYSVEAFGK